MIVKLNKGGAARDPDVVWSIAFSTFNEVSVKNKVMFNIANYICSSPYLSTAGVNSTRDVWKTSD